MFILQSYCDYPDDVLITAHNKAELEEMALSFFEEDEYEWFCVFIDTLAKYELKNIPTVIRYSTEEAKSNFFLEIKELPTPIDN